MTETQRFQLNMPQTIYTIKNAMESICKPMNDSVLFSINSICIMNGYESCDLKDLVLSGYRFIK